MRKNYDTEQKNDSLRSYSNSSNYHLPKVTNMSSPTKKVKAFQLPRIDQPQE